MLRESLYGRPSMQSRLPQLNTYGTEQVTNGETGYTERGKEVGEKTATAGKEQSRDTV